MDMENVGNYEEFSEDNCSEGTEHEHSESETNNVKKVKFKRAIL